MPDPDAPRSIAEITDQTGLGKAAAAILSSLEKLFGAAFRPFQIRREGKAHVDVDVYRTLALAEAKIRVDAILATGDAEFEERAKTRVVSEIMREQRNIEAVVNGAITFTALTAPDIDQAMPIEDDWMSLFLNTCKRFSSGDIQALFARILAFQATAGGVSPMLVENMKYLDGEMSSFLRDHSQTLLHLHQTPAYFFHRDMRCLRRLKQAGFIFMDNSTDITINVDPFVISMSDLDGDLTFIQPTFIGEELFDARCGKDMAASIIGRHQGAPKPDYDIDFVRDGLAQLILRQSKFAGLITIDVIGRNIMAEELVTLSSFKFLVRHDGSDGIDTCEHAEQRSIPSLRQMLDPDAFLTLNAIYEAIASACKMAGINVMKTGRAQKTSRRAQKKVN